MSKSNASQTQRKAEHAGSELDALLNRAVSADKRANKPAAMTRTVTHDAKNPSGDSENSVGGGGGATISAESPDASGGAGERRSKVRQQVLPLERLERLTVRFTQDEAKLLEKARGVARGMGFKISDTAVFRLAINAFRPESMTPANLKAILAADHRRKNG